MDVAAYSVDPPPMLLTLKGTPEEVGYAYAYLLGSKIESTYTAFMGDFLKEKWEEDLMALFLDTQWTKYLSLGLPLRFQQELSGMRLGGRARNLSIDVAQYIGRVTVVSNFPSQVVEEIERLIAAELSGEDAAWHVPSFVTRGMLRDLARRAAGKLGHRCSEWAAWGRRTPGLMASGRNLDWESNSGINHNKLVTVWDVDGTKHKVCSFGFVGLYGVLTGMNSAGLVLTESGYDSVPETFLGFPWIWRLRAVMESAASLDGAMQVWNSTQNTLGIFHGVFSAQDAQKGVEHPAAILECMQNYTAMFWDDDPRERAHVVDGKRMGKPAQQAVYRTNSAFDPVMLEFATSITKFGQDSSVRYFIAADTVEYYDETETPIGQVEALNITSLLGDKGGMHFYYCNKTSDEGMNILSVTYLYDQSIENGTALVAWGIGQKETWRPACCGTYVQLSMDDLFNNFF